MREVLSVPTSFNAPELHNLPDHLAAGDFFGQSYFVVGTSLLLGEYTIIIRDTHSGQTTTLQVVINRKHPSDKMNHLKEYNKGTKPELTQHV